MLMFKRNLSFTMLAARLVLMGLGVLAAVKVYAAPHIVHQPPLEAKSGQPVVLNATVTDAGSPVFQVKLYYRATGALGYQFQLMTGTGYNFTATIPASAIAPAGVDYYLEARNGLGELSTSPIMSAALAPYHLVVREAIGAPVLQLLLPENGSVMAPEEATVVVVTINAGSGRPDLSTLEVTFDENNVTSQCQITENMVTFPLAANLADGLHGLRVKVRNTHGAEAHSPTWSFTIRRAGTPAPTPVQGVRFNGGLTAESQYAAMNRDSDSALYTAQPRGWLNRLNLNFNGQANGTNFLGSAYLTSEEKPGRQPVDRMRLELFDPAFNLTLGDLYPVFSPFSLDNVFVRGGGLNLNSGSADGSRALFQAVGGLTRIAVPGTYEQWLWAGRWRYDFLPGVGVGFNAVTVNDYANSLNPEQQNGSLPAANLAVTGEGSAKLFWTRQFHTLVYGEYGLSYYDEAMNLTGIALAPAWRGGMRWEWTGRSYVKLEYLDTGAKYVSLASPWLIGDWRGVSGDAQIYLIDNALALTAAGNFWRDNLEGQKSFSPEALGTTLPATVDLGVGTTTTLFLSGALNYRVASWLPSVSLGYSINRQKNDVLPASTVDNRTDVMNLGAGTQIPFGGDQLFSNVSYSQTRSQTLTTPETDIVSSSFLLSTMYLLGGSWNFSGGFGMTGTETRADTSQTVNYVLGNVRASWKVIPGSLDLGAGWETLNGRGNQDSVKNTLTTLSLTGTYYPVPAHSLGLTLSTLEYDDQVTAARSYSQFVANLRYGLSF